MDCLRRETYTARYVPHEKRVDEMAEKDHYMVERGKEALVETQYMSEDAVERSPIAVARYEERRKAFAKVVIGIGEV